MQVTRFLLKILQHRHNVKINRNVSCNVHNINISLLRDQTTDQTESTPTVGVLDAVSEDVSTLSPYFPKAFNLAAYVNSSESLQSLVQLNVDLSKIEKKPYIAEKILKLDFEHNIKKHIFFLKDYVESEEIGHFITKNPMILCEPLEDLEVRINYLESKKFLWDQICRIITKNPFWLMFSTKRIDNRLGFYQQKFELSGDEVRMLATKQPKLITYNLHHIITNTFVIKEEMGFEDKEVKKMLITKPKLWMINQKALLQRFNYLHNVMKIPHSTLLNFPEVLLCRNFKVKQRHFFLQKLGRDQYDPRKENYVPIKALVQDTDVEFCKQYAKCNVNDFNIFLKTM